MARHHYIPISILSTFASTDAWRAVDASSDVKSRIANNDRETILYGQQRNWPVCVYEKDRHRLTRKPIGKVFSQAGLYQVPDYNDRLTRAFVHFNLLFNHPDDPLQIPGFDEFMQLGDEPLDPELIEQVNVGEIDREFARLLPALRNGKRLTEDQISTVLRFVAFSRFRTPIWREVYLPETFGRTLFPYRQAIIQLCRNAKNYEEKWGLSFDGIMKAIDDHIYHMALVEYSSKEFNALSSMRDPKVTVLHSRSSLRFVTCDNPSRPYYPDRVRRMFAEQLPGFADPRVQVVYPIDPNSCLLITSNPTHPVFSHRSVKTKQVRAVNAALAIMAAKEIVLPEPNTSVFEDWLRLEELRPIKRP